MKKYNSNAPLSQNYYWNLQDNDRALLDDAESILLYYIQSWGQTNKKRLETLADVANKIGYHIEVVRNGEEDCFKHSDKEKDFPEMVAKIREIRRGNFESEAGQIYNILKRYYKKISWWQKLLKIGAKK